MTEAPAPDLFALLREVQRSAAAKYVTSDTANADAKNFLCLLRNTMPDDPEPANRLSNSRAWLALCKRAGYDLVKEEEQSSFALTCAAHYVASSWKRHAIDCNLVCCRHSCRISVKQRGVSEKRCESSETRCVLCGVRCGVVCGSVTNT